MAPTRALGAERIMVRLISEYRPDEVPLIMACMLNSVRLTARRSPKGN
jgi:hypothetical protein